MKTSKILGLIIGLVQLGSAVAMIIGMHTMLGVFATALPSGETELEIQYGDPVIIPFTLTPVNNGYLEATMEVSMSMLVDGVEVASDSASVTIPPGSTIPVALELSIPADEAEEYLQAGVDVQWKTDIGVTTLYDIISFGNQLIVEGGGQ